EEEEGPSSSDEDQRVYLVPFRWWKDAQEPSSTQLRKGVPYVASPASPFGGPLKLFNSIFNSDIAVSLRKDDGLLCNGQSSEVGLLSREYALISGDMWLQTLKWHSDSRDSSSKDAKSLEDMSDVFPLQLRLSVIRETSGLSDNSVECFRRACKIFNVEVEPVSLWDFSGQTSLLLLNDNNGFMKEANNKQAENELLLELQVYGLSDSVRNRGARRDDSGPYQNGSCSTSSGSSSVRFNGNSFESGTLGLTGLQNLGNTCFMNSALQCLAHTPKLVDYFLGDYRREINKDNPLGMDGEIASAFGDLLKKLWAPGATPLAPRTFKLKLAHFAPQFSGYNQHDSQELLAFLLDGLHEDLNRVKHKPYFEAKDSDGRPDEEVADEYWRNHLARNDSIIVDVCQGQYRSTLVCPICRKVSVTFDPFMYLSLPLPSTSSRTMTLTVVKTHGSGIGLAPFTVTVPKNGKLRDLTSSLSVACGLGEEETLLIAEVYNNRIIRYLEEPNDALSLIRDDDLLVAYRMEKIVDEASLFVFMHQRIDGNVINGVRRSSWRVFGVPLVVSKSISGCSDVRETYERLLAPFSSEVLPEIGNGDVGSDDHPGEETPDEFRFWVTNDRGNERGTELGGPDEALSNDPEFPGGKKLYILASWPEKKAKRYDVQPLTVLPKVFKSGFVTRRPEESVSLYKCLEAFLREEPLGPDDMWFCPVCKKHCQAAKKLDLWRLPEILVIHLKRFSYSRFLKNKLDAFVDFPLHDLDLAGYIAAPPDERISRRYMLYAVSNHYGTMGGGHYTAFV
ncbi:ubiquitin carboxyl-terminal hydrolase, partial [Genlisea aurea]